MSERLTKAEVEACARAAWPWFPVDGACSETPAERHDIPWEAASRGENECFATFGEKDAMLKMTRAILRAHSRLQRKKGKVNG